MYILVYTWFPEGGSMIAKIQKWGNSQGIRFSREILRQTHISIGDEVDIEVRDHEIVVKPIRLVRGKYRLRTLLPANMSKSHEINWGSPSGKEVW